MGRRKYADVGTMDRGTRMMDRGGLLGDEGDWRSYLAVQESGMFNMLDPRARQMTGMSKEVYMDIIKNYSDYARHYGKSFAKGGITDGKRNQLGRDINN
ncbi:MAG TPA: hypothetical protein DCM40_29720, partial [Maribacter sp.]|nr:hypothetical protein [Maribacter sp.]